MSPGQTLDDSQGGCLDTYAGGEENDAVLGGLKDELQRMTHG